MLCICGKLKSAKMYRMHNIWKDIHEMHKIMKDGGKKQRMPENSFLETIEFQYLSVLVKK